jgi:NAD(P)-dependent dehydrogenase (short-subunit alcohol dehydrogenase family)
MNSTPDLQLRGQVCLIAGASGAIGTAVAERFRAAGATLALTYWSQRTELPGDANGKQNEILQLPLNVRSREQVQELIQKVVDRFGTIHCLVNCTGVLGPVGPTAAVPAEQWVAAIEANLIGSFYLTQAVLPAMLAQSWGKIIHFSGGGAAYARPFYTAYSASKAALVRFSESLAEELRDSHIDVNAIAPGPVRSRMWDQMGSLAEPDARTRAELRKMQETGGVPAERAAELAVFLASRRSDGLTGRLISAVYDNWAAFDQRIPDIMRSEAGTLRRVPLG